MATYTDNYQLTKPLYSEIVDVSVLNNNMDKVDDIMHNSQISLADAYDQTQTYELGEKVMYEMLLYRCVSRITTPEVWNPSHWERTTAADEGGNYVDITPTYQSGLKIADTNIDGDLDEINVPYMTGATSGADGTAGLPPAPQEGDEGKFLKGDGSWGDVAGSAEDIDYDNTESGLVADDVQGAIDEVVSMIPSLPTVYGEASGAVASFEDGTANPLEEFVIGIEPVQAGTGDPSPSNPRAISGWTGANININGKNLCNKSDIIISTVRYFSIGSDTFSGAPNGSIKVEGGTAYTFSVSGTNSTLLESIGIYDSSNTRIAVVYNNKKITFTPSQTTYIRISGSVSNYVFVSFDNYDMQLEKGSEATAYVPYTKTTVPISWQTEAGTVYGGKLDVKRGNGKKKQGYFKIDSNFIVTMFDHGTTNSMFTINFANNNLPEAIASTIISSHFSQNNTGDGAISNSTTGLEITIANSRISPENAVGFKQWCIDNNVDFYYETNATEDFSAPQTQVSSILGSNNIWTDTGDIINCKYIRDLNSTINILWNAVFNQSNTRSLSLMKSVKSEDTDTKEIEEETEEEETEKEIQKEIQKEGNDENQR